VSVSRVALCGTGRWGQVMAASLARLPALQLVAACDPSPEARSQLQARWPGLPTFAALDEVLADPRLDAVLVATPPAEHAACADRALASGKHVFVEKPLALSSVDASGLVRTAQRMDRILFVGHLLLHHPAVRALFELRDAGALGPVRYIEAVRAGAPRPGGEDEPLWSLGPHDVAVALALLGELPVRVAARRLGTGTPLLLATLEWACGAQMTLRLGRLLEQRERRLTVVGTAGAACFDDSEARPRLRATRAPFGASDVQELPLPDDEPLLVELAAFARAVQPPPPGRVPIAAGRISQLLCSGPGGEQVVRVLEACARSLAAGGAEQTLAG
jgi:predicted dehydrogenase